MAPAPEEPSRVGTLSHIAIVTKYAFLNYFRARRFYVMLIVVLLIGALITFAVGYYRPPGVLSDALSFYDTIWGRFATFVVILSAALFGGDAISGEFQNRTGYFLVPNPLRRSAIYTGKWLAALAASTIILGLFALISLGNGIYYFGMPIPSEVLQSFLYGWVYLVAALSLTFAFSSLFKSSSISILMSVILLLFVFDIINLVTSDLAGVEPWFSVTYGAGIIANVLTVPYPDHMYSIPVTKRITIVSYNATIPEGLLIMGIYFVVMALVGLWLFERKEFTS
jgi:ABC-2 type transport system permease protein